MQPDKKIFDQIAYDPTTGVFTWRVDKTRVKRGDKAGRLNTNGHRQIRINGKCYLAHKIAWWLCWGQWPDFILDHIDGNPDNNRIDNLRPSNHSLNNQNTRLRKDNTSGYKGVYWDARDQCWKAYLRLNKKAIHLGCFVDKEDAINARQIAQKRWHPHHRTGLN